MAVDYKRKIKPDNSHLSDLTSAKFLRIDGSATPTTVVAAGTGCNLLRVILNTNGATIGLRSNSRQIGTIALDAPEGTFNYGIYCSDGLQVDTGGAVDVTVVFAS
jgi:hypothetical protein